MKIAKSELTLKLEKEIWNATYKQGVFGCFEVTIGWFGNERVDYMTYDTKGIFRCYEIKVSKSDFYSKNHNTFIGHYNYYVMPQELYEQVKDDIPKYVGVYIPGGCRKNAKKQVLGVDEQILKNSMIRSLCREVQKKFMSGDPWTIDIQKRNIRRYKSQMEEYRRKYHELMEIGRSKFGPRWYKEDEREAQVNN